MANPWDAGSFDRLEFAAGHILGWRTWKYSPTMSGLRGRWQWLAWSQGVNTAACRAGIVPYTLYMPESMRPKLCDSEDVPGKSCKCGFWAYWTPPSEDDEPAECYVGVIKGWGKVIAGDKGFRCKKAEILALAWRREMKRGVPMWVDSSPPPPRDEPESISAVVRQAYGVPVISYEELLATWEPQVAKSREDLVGGLEEGSGGLGGLGGSEE